MIRIVQEFTSAVAKTRGVLLPSTQVLMDVKARRFLYEMVTSEIGEYVVAQTDVDKIDAVVDAIYYILDSCLRFGVTPVLPQNIEPAGSWGVNDPYYLYGLVVEFLKAEDEASQLRCINQMLFAFQSCCILPVLPFLEEVAKANNSKINKDGFVILNDKGKVMKPEGFVPPDLSSIYKDLMLEKLGCTP